MHGSVVPTREFREQGTKATHENGLRISTFPNYKKTWEVGHGLLIAQAAGSRTWTEMAKSKTNFILKIT